MDARSSADVRLLWGIADAPAILSRLFSNSRHVSWLNAIAVYKSTPRLQSIQKRFAFGAEGMLAVATGETVALRHPILLHCDDTLAAVFSVATLTNATRTPSTSIDQLVSFCSYNRGYDASSCLDKRTSARLSGEWRRMQCMLLFESLAPVSVQRRRSIGDTHSAAATTTTATHTLPLPLRNDRFLCHVRLRPMGNVRFGVGVESSADYLGLTELTQATDLTASAMIQQCSRRLDVSLSTDCTAAAALSFIHSLCGFRHATNALISFGARDMRIRVAALTHPARASPSWAMTYAADVSLSRDAAFYQTFGVDGLRVSVPKGGRMRCGIALHSASDGQRPVTWSLGVTADVSLL
eukprot:Opistho-2@54140